MRNKIVIYDKNATPLNGGFLGHGFGVLKEATRCEIYEELNGDYSLELDYPLTGIKAGYLTKWNIIRANGQLFRIYKVEDSTEDNTRIAYARHIFYDLASDFILDDRTVESTLSDALSACIPPYFKGHFTTSSDIPITNTIYVVRKDGVKATFDTLNRWGVGELVRDNFHVAINWNKGIDTNAIFTAKKMKGIEVITDTTDLTTRILPVGKDGLQLPEIYVEIPNWSSEEYPPFHITKEISFDEVEDEGTLRELAMQYAQQCGFAALNIKIDIEQVAGTTAYQKLYKWNQFNVGDVVTVKHPQIDDLRVKTKIISRRIDVVTESCEIELGQPLSSLDDFFFNSVQKQLVNANASVKNDLQYWQNASTLTIDTNTDKVATLSVSTKHDADSISAIVYVTLHGIADRDTDLKVELWRNNVKMLLEPVVALKKGVNNATFHWPVVGISQNENHIFDLHLKTTAGTFTFDKYQAVMTVQGVGITATAGKTQPHPTVFVEWHVEPFRGKHLSSDVEVGIQMFDHKDIHVSTDIHLSSIPARFSSDISAHPVVS